MRKSPRPWSVVLRLACSGLSFVLSQAGRAAPPAVADPLGLRPADVHAVVSGILQGPSTRCSSFLPSQGFSSGTVGIGFDSTVDSLCFENAGGIDQSDTPLFASLARVQGACTGMSALVSLSHSNLVYRPGIPGEASEFRARLDAAIRLARRGCPFRVEVPGFANLRDACLVHRKIFQNAAVELNAALTMEGRVVGSYLEGGFFPDHGLQRAEVFRSLQQIHRSLRGGSTPLLVTERWRSEQERAPFPHTVLVTNMSFPVTAEGRREALLEVYDSNASPTRAQIRFPLTADLRSLDPRRKVRFSWKQDNGREWETEQDVDQTRIGSVALAERRSRDVCCNLGRELAPWLAAGEWARICHANPSPSDWELPY